MGWSSKLVQHLLRAMEDNMMNRFHTFAYTCSKLSEQEKTTWYHCGVLSHQEPLMSTLWTHLSTKQLIYLDMSIPQILVRDLLSPILDTFPINPSSWFQSSSHPQGFPWIVWFSFEGTIFGSCQIASGFWSFPQAKDRDFGSHHFLGTLGKSWISKAWTCRRKYVSLDKRRAPYLDLGIQLGGFLASTVDYRHLHTRLDSDSCCRDPVAVLVITGVVLLLMRYHSLPLGITTRCRNLAKLPSFLWSNGDHDSYCIVLVFVLLELIVLWLISTI